MRQEPYKVYGYIYPVKDALFQALQEVVYENNISNCLEFDKDILRISFEGVFFPVEEVITVLRLHAEENYNGKIDVLDLEEWTLHRTIFKGTDITTSKVSLNHVLDYSGY